MPRMPAYQSRYGDTITELLSRRGDIAAQGAMRSGEIWGSTVAGLGNLAANTYQQYSEQKAEKKAQEAKSQAFTAALENWTNNDHKTNLGAMVKLYGPDGAKVYAGVNEALGDKPPTPEGFKMKIGGLRALLDAHGKDWFLANYDTLAPSVAKEANAFFGVDILNVDIPPEGRSEFVDSIYALDKQFNPQKDALGTNKVLGPEDVLISPEGKEIARGIGKSPADKAPVTATFGGRVHQLDRATNTWVPLGASEAALGREAALGKEERGREDAAKKAEQAGNETRTQVEAAFAAMETALKEVEKYSGTAAFTSPLEAKNARQQYDDASKAFAATLSRATGDTRISDLDRKAYAGLLAYAGPGAGLLKVARPDLVRKRLEEAKKMFKSASDVGLVGGASGLSESAPSDPLGIRK